MLDLNNQRILVTGASKGIGKAIAKKLLDDGARVVLHYRSTADSVAELQNHYGASNAIPIQADLQDEAEAIELFKTSVEKLSGLDSVVLNAGIFEPHPINDTMGAWLKVWRKTMQVNLDSVGILTKLCLEYFKKQNQGRLIYIGSRAAFRGETERAMEAISQIGPDKVIETLALDRLTTPEDISPTVALMCSGLMDHATGTTIDFNAGSHIR